MVDEEFILQLKKSIWFMKDHTECDPISSLHIKIRDDYDNDTSQNQEVTQSTQASRLQNETDC